MIQILLHKTNFNDLSDRKTIVQFSLEMILNLESIRMIIGGKKEFLKGLDGQPKGHLEDHPELQDLKTIQKQIV